jgi:cohesin loading factor subunit SCC2
VIVCSSRLRDGRSIRTVSALLLQLVQTSAHDVRTAVRRISKRRQQSLARNDSWVDTSEQRAFLDNNDLEV